MNPSHDDQSRFNDLLDNIHFTEQVTASIYGATDAAEVFATINALFSSSKRYTASILLLTDDESGLSIVTTSMGVKKTRAAENAARVRMNKYKIGFDRSSIYRRVVQENETIHVRVNDIVLELFPKLIASIIGKITGYDKAYAILTPLIKHRRTIGAFAISAPELAEHFIPSVKILAKHISSALELADERAERKRAEQEVFELNRSLEQKVKNRPVNYGKSKNACTKRKKWRRSAILPAALHTISTTSWPE